jgi:tetratricopeptide (TPR) repeat protein
MRIILSIIFLLLCQAIIAQKTGKEYYVLAEQKSVNGKLKKAYEYYYKAAELDKNYFYYVKAAEAYFLSHNNSKSKNVKRTLYLYNKSMKLKNWNLEGLLSRARYFNYIAQYTNALNDLDSLLVKDTLNTEGYLLKAEIYMMKKDTSQAFATYKNGLTNIAEEKEKARIYNHKGTHCYFKQYWQQSILAYQQEIKIKGQDKFINNCFLSSAYYYVGEKDNACYYYKFCDINKYPSLKTKNELINICR